MEEVMALISGIRVWRLYNPFASTEYNRLNNEYYDIEDSMYDLAKELEALRVNQILVWSQMRDAMLTQDEQRARLRALDEVGAPQ